MKDYSKYKTAYSETLGKRVDIVKVQISNGWVLIFVNCEDGKNIPCAPQSLSDFE
jgi:hypothetical protein